MSLLKFYFMLTYFFDILCDNDEIERSINYERKN